MNTLAFGIGPIGWTEMLVILGIGLLLFGKRLPEVGRSLGKGIVEFKKGLKGIEDEIERESSRPPPPPVARAPLTAGGVDARVSVSDPVEHAPEAVPQPGETRPA